MTIKIKALEGSRGRKMCMVNIYPRLLSDFCVLFFSNRKKRDKSEILIMLQRCHTLVLQQELLSVLGKEITFGSFLLNTVQFN